MAELRSEVWLFLVCQKLRASNIQALSCDLLALSIFKGCQENVVVLPFHVIPVRTFEDFQVRLGKEKG